MTNCKQKVFVTAFPDKNPVKLCQEHFIKEMGHLIDPNAPIVDMTEDKPTQEKQECPCSCHKSAKDPQEGCKHCIHSPLDNSLKDMDTKDTDWTPGVYKREFKTLKEVMECSHRYEDMSMTCSDCGEQWSPPTVPSNDWEKRCDEVSDKLKDFNHQMCPICGIDPEELKDWIKQTISTEVQARDKEIYSGLRKTLSQKHWKDARVTQVLELLDAALSLDNISNEISTENKISRVEVIDSTGRAYVKWNVKVEQNIQDDGRTLKIFVKEDNPVDLYPEGTEGRI